MAKDFTQREGIDYNKIFSPVSCKNSFRIIMALVAHYDLELHQMDVKAAFLNGDLEKNLHGTTKRFCCGRKRTYGKPPEQIHLWIKISIKTMIFKV